MTGDQYRLMSQVLEEHMTVDEFGLSKISNIYCDTDDYYLIRKSIEHPKFKEKLRIRCYGEFKDDALVFMEIKRKVKGIGYKRRVQMTFKEARDMLDGKEIETSNPQITGELREFIRRYQPKLKVHLTYDRVAMFGNDDSDLRITLDRNIRFRKCDQNLDFSKESRSIIDDESKVLMEVKAPGMIPMWLVNALSELKIYQASFSKIGACYTRYIAPETCDHRISHTVAFKKTPAANNKNLVFPRAVHSSIG